MRTPNGEHRSISPATGLRTGTRDKGVSILVELGARDVDAVKLAFEGAGTRARRLSGTNGPPMRACRALGWIDAEIGEHAADAARFAVVALFQIGERRVCRLSTLSSEAYTRASMPSSPPASCGWRCGSLAGSSRDSSRASRSGGAVKITVSLIGDGLTVLPALALGDARAG